MRIFSLIIKKIVVAAFWFIVWDIAARIVGSSIILVGPVETFGRLFALTGTTAFWSRINYSLLRIMLGFVLSLGVGVLLAVACHNSKIIRDLITPLINVIKSIPVVSFALLAIFWISRDYMSVFIAFVTVLPIVFFNTQKGIENTDEKLIEMADVFRVGIFKKIKHIYVPLVMPFVISAAASGLGFAWKAGIAAEVIGFSRSSIGGGLHEARNFLLTADLLAWTIAIVVLAWAMEKVIFFLFGRFKKWQ
ncbi:MAG: ABC transporter permease subunit [Defluviitaleaceae bacterium]|nr:ABC transporter permease subunit [Defluviitaleaceae bacterium]